MKKVLNVITTFVILVALHELGHLIMCSLFHIPVYGFYIEPTIPNNNIFATHFCYILTDYIENLPFWKLLYLLILAPLVSQGVYLYKGERSKYWIIFCVWLLRYDLLGFLTMNWLIA